MERERLKRLLEEPGKVAREDLSDLKALTERYPWFSGAQVLRATGELATGDVLSDETLRSAAVHVPSRAVLFDLVEKPSGAPPVEVQEERSVPTAPMHVVKPLEELAPVVQLAPVVEDLTAPAPKEEIAPEAPAAEEDPLERQILEAALASAYDLTLHATLDPVPAAAEPQQPAPMAEQTPAPAVAMAPPVPVAPVAEPRIPVAVTVARKSGKLRFTEWLDETAAERTATTVPVTAKRPETVATGAAPEMRTTAAEATVPPTTPPLDAKSLVDRFIGQEIQVPAPRATFFTPQQAAKRSLDDSAGLVTETLARIHAKQGNTAKAIEAYNKLALKYPDKSAYFAALAKSLEEQQNK